MDLKENEVSLLPGEKLEKTMPTKNGELKLTSFRLLHVSSRDLRSVPRGLIDQLDFKDAELVVYCKDGTTFRCFLESSSAASTAYNLLMTPSSRVAPQKLHELFAFVFFQHIQLVGEVENCEFLPQRNFNMELKRMQLDVTKAWRICQLNVDYKFCSSYPSEFLVPRTTSDVDLESVQTFRSKGRIPTVTWRHHRGNGAVMARCSQPETGLLSWRNCEDESLLRSIVDACAVNEELRPSGFVRDVKDTENSSGDISKLKNSTNKQALLVIDARSHVAATANRIKGGGLEFPEYYPDCEIQFMDIQNIHSIRKSFVALRELCSNNTSSPSVWLTGLQSSYWLENIGSLLSATARAVEAIDQKGQSVLVHCSDGWDRTSQICALSQLALDSYYRTIQGFSVLIEREWLAFGHKFADRCGQGVSNADANERSPIFLQFLDCVHQLIKDYPTAFQFNMTFLLKLAVHTYSNLFGTFLCNTEKQRKEHHLYKCTLPVWIKLNVKDDSLKNALYDESQRQVLYPRSKGSALHFWADLFLRERPPVNRSSPPHVSLPAQPSQAPVRRARSEDRVSGRSPDIPRTNSQPLVGHEEQATKERDLQGLCLEHPAPPKADDPPPDDLSCSSETLSGALATAQGVNSSTDTLAASVEEISKSENTNGHAVQKGNDETAKVMGHDQAVQSHEYAEKTEEEEKKFVNGHNDQKCIDNATKGHKNVSTLDGVRDSSAGVMQGQILGNGQISHAAPINELLDDDGLVYHVDPVQKRILEITEQLQEQIRVAAGLQTPVDVEEQRSLPESVDSTDSESYVKLENPIVGWVPDHAVTQCMRCHATFWLGRRKHHCRNCGHVVCYDCSKYEMALPNQNLESPVRVCRTCYFK